MTNPLKKGNWGLRILALILAIVLYHALKTDAVRKHAHANNERSFLQFH